MLHIRLNFSHKAYVNYIFPLFFTVCIHFLYKTIFPKYFNSSDTELNGCQGRTHDF